MSALVETRGLRAGYGNVEIVRGVDLVVEPGEVVAVLGPNGAGKTTTLLTLAGELEPLGGDVDVLGCGGRTPLHVRARKGLAFVTQERAVLMNLTTAENLRVSRCDVGRAIELFPELEAHLGRRVGLLSGGQQQMLALARGLARQAATAARRRALPRPGPTRRRTAPGGGPGRGRRRRGRPARRAARPQGHGGRRSGPDHAARADRPGRSGGRATGPHRRHTRRIPVDERHWGNQQ